jgi:hypothetical protein
LRGEVEALRDKGQEEVDELRMALAEEQREKCRLYRKDA